jgi:FkbM family methyltransferase
MNQVLDRALAAYSYLPYHPGKGWLYNRILPKLNLPWDKPRRRARSGVTFQLNLRDKVAREVYYFGFARRDCRALQQIIKPGDTILDVGANIGYFSLLFAKWLRGEGAVHAFEPFPDTLRTLSRNVDLNPRLKSLITVHDVALSNYVGRTSVVVPDEGNSGCNYLSMNGRVQISVTTLDAAARELRLSHLDFVKVDIEGSEVAMLEGSAETIERFRPVMMIEMNPIALQRFGKTPADLFSVLGRFRYRLTVANPFGKLRPLSRLPITGEEPNIFALPVD